MVVLNKLKVIKMVMEMEVPAPNYQNGYGDGGSSPVLKTPSSASLGLTDNSKLARHAESAVQRAASLIRKRTPLGPYRRPVPDS